MKYNKETKKVEAESPEVELEQRLTHFAKKKGIYHLHEKVVNKLDELNKAMEAQKVSQMDVMNGRAPENILKLKEELDKAYIVRRGVLDYHLANEPEYGKTKDIVKEMEQGIVSEEMTKEQQEAITAAELKYALNESPANARDLIKAKLVSKIEGGAAGTWDSIEAKQREEIRAAENNIRQRNAEANAGKQEAEVEAYQTALKNKHDPTGQRIAAMKLKQMVVEKDNAEEAAKLWAQEGANE